ncbi:hypothetical protein DPX16_13038 [Anabarilius grahami]|uniref:Uncharacterized protein n=1 Tax=Anabarilius grahami TaxID=495550 RepID=A0A3N0XDN2_ANAGA|nr:hypothetical protein DPX16_13038 [Anabarilius grahami]
MGKNKDLSDFDKGQIYMARRLGQSVSEAAKLVDCSRSAVVKIYQQWSEEEQTTNLPQRARPRLIDARGKLRLTHLIRDNRKPTVAQVTQNVNDGNVKKVSQNRGQRRSIRCASSSQPTLLEGSALEACEGPTKDSCEDEERTQKTSEVVENPVMED